MDTSTYIFCAPLPGKPSPSEARIEGQTRSRVILKPQEGNTCQYYALQILRDENRIGKNISPLQQTAREYEILFSKCRKMQTDTDKEFHLKLDFAVQLTQNFQESITKEDAKSLILKSSALFPAEFLDLCCKTLTSFIEQEEYTTLLEFVQNNYVSALRKINRMVFEKFGIENNECFSIENAADFHMKPVTEINNNDLNTYENTILLACMQLSYGMRNSDWHPVQPITSLIKELKDYGPHFVKGQFGQEYYSSKPFELREKIENRPVFGWKVGSKRIFKNDNHAVVVVGAKAENGKELVYFIDPLDGSDPANITTQKIYVISYQTFCTQIATVRGLRLVEKENPHFVQMNASKNDYAFHMEKKKPT